MMATATWLSSLMMGVWKQGAKQLSSRVVFIEGRSRGLWPQSRALAAVAGFEEKEVIEELKNYDITVKYGQLL